jgi:hypothetical protein
MRKTFQESGEELNKALSNLKDEILAPLIKFIERDHFVFRSRIINCIYWEVKQYFFLGIQIYSKRINIQPGHE